jgi:prepilin-type N-terminal cleavage/methylation domain-containing protein
MVAEMTSTTGPKGEVALRRHRHGASTTGDKAVGGSPLHCHRKQGGFTLMELILVLVVISMVLGLCSPSLRGFFASRQTADAAGNILLLTKWARSEAVSQGHRCRVNFDPAAGTYWLTVQEGGAFVPVRHDLGRRYQMPEGAVVAVRCEVAGASPSYVQFYPSGRSDTAAIEIAGRQGTFIVANAGPTEPFRISEGEVSP